MLTFARMAAPLNKKSNKGKQQTFGCLTSNFKITLERLGAKLDYHLDLSLSRFPGAYTMEINA